MSTTLDQFDMAAPPDLRAKRSWRSAKSHIMVALMFLSFLVILVPLALIIGTVLSKGAGIVFRDFPAWFTDRSPISPRSTKPGMAQAIVGTLVISGFASLIAIPLGILGAIYLHEYGGSSKPARIIRFLANVMTGVPSIVMGLFVYVIFTLRYGLSGLGGSLALACLMMPVIIRSTEEMLRLVPGHLREASYALGTRKARTILTVVLPSALPGIVSGCLLAVARAAGETAPLLFTIGASRKINANVLSGANSSLSAQIFGLANEVKPNLQERGWGAAFTLVAIAFLFTVLARLMTNAYQKRR
jgi:phosphate transport system permease protein